MGCRTDPVQRGQSRRAVIFRRSIAKPAALSAVFRKAFELSQELIDDLALLAAQFDLL